MRMLDAWFIKMVSILGKEEGWSCNVDTEKGKYTQTYKNLS